MPIYEFYCPDCHTVFSFFSSRIDTEAAPSCPRCQRQHLGRRPSRFAVLEPSRSDDAASEDQLFDGLDERKLEGAMDTLMREMETDGENDDPRAMGAFVRRFTELTGLSLGERMEDMVQRLEAGEDPDELEQELGGDDEALDDFFALKSSLQGRKAKPKIDDELYFL